MEESVIFDEDRVTPSLINSHITDDKFIRFKVKVCYTRRRQPKMKRLYERQARQDEKLSKLADNGNENQEEKSEWTGEP